MQKNVLLGFDVLNRIEAAAMAAAVSPASSDPGAEVVIAHAGLAMVMSSGLPQDAWSTLPSPTCLPFFTLNVFVCA